MARRDATSIEFYLMIEMPAGASKDNNIRTGSPQRHHTVHRTVGNVWDSLYIKHQLRESNLTLERVYACLQSSS